MSAASSAKTANLANPKQLPIPGMLFLLWAFHAANNIFFFLTTDTPPSYDCGYHLQLSVNFYENLLAFGQESYFWNLLFSSSFYPLFGYMAATPFFLVLGISDAAANMGNLFYLALLIVSVYQVGRLIADERTGLLAAFIVSFFPFVYGISRVYYVESALLAVTAFAVWRLLRTGGFADRRQSVYFGLSVGLGMMTKWTFPIFLAGPVAWVALSGLVRAWGEEAEKVSRKPSLFHIDLGGLFLGLGIGSLLLARKTDQVGLWAPLSAIPILAGLGWSSPREPLRRYLLNLALAGLAAALVCYPWYIRNWDLIRSVAMPFMDSDYTGQFASSWGSALTPEAFLYYPFALEANQLGPPLFLCFVLSAMVFPWRKWRTFAPVGVWIAVPFIIITLIPNRDARHVSPFLPAVGLLMGFSLMAIRPPALRQGLVGLTLLAALWQFGLNTYDLPLPKGSHFRLNRWGHFYSFWNHGVYGSGSERKVHWPHREVVRDFKACTMNDNGAQPVLRCLLDFPHFHQGVFEFMARGDQGSWTAVFDRDSLDPAAEWNRAAQADAVLFANDDLPNDLYTLPGRPLPFEYNRGPHSFFRARFPDQRVYSLPEATSATLACRDSSRLLSAMAREPIPLGSGISVASGTVVPPPATGSEGIQVRLTFAPPLAATGPLQLRFWVLDPKGAVIDTAVAADSEATRASLTATFLVPLAAPRGEPFQLALEVPSGTVEPSGPPLPEEKPLVFFRDLQRFD